MPDEALKKEPFNKTEAENNMGIWSPAIRPRDGAAITTYVWTENYDRFEQIVVYKRRYEAARNGQIIETELHTMTLRWYFKYELMMMLEQAGFRDIFIYGDYADEPATTASSETVYGARR